MSNEDKSTKKDSKIISDMRKIVEKEPVFDKWYDELITEIEETDKEYEKSVSHYKEVMKDSDKVLELTEEKLKDDGKKKKSTSFTEENVKLWIEEALVRKGILTNEKSYSHKPHLASLPYDHNINDVDKLNERKEEIEKRIDEQKKKLSNKDLEIVERTNSIIELDNKCEEDIKYAREHFESLSNHNNDDGSNEDVWKKIDKLISNSEKSLNKLFDSYEEYLASDSTERIKNTLRNKEIKKNGVITVSKEEQRLLDIGSEFSKLSFNTDGSNTKLIKNCEVLGNKIEDSIFHHNNSRVFEHYKNDELKEFDSMNRILNDYESELERTVAHIDRVTQ